MCVYVCVHVLDITITNNAAAVDNANNVDMTMTTNAPELSIVIEVFS